MTKNQIIGINYSNKFYKSTWEVFCMNHQHLNIEYSHLILENVKMLGFVFRGGGVVAHNLVRPCDERYGGVTLTP